MKIGAQLFTLRDYCQTPEDLASTLKRVANIGYRYVQISGVCEYDPAWLKTVLDELELTCVLTHIPIDKLKADPKQVAVDHDILNCDYVGLGWYAFADKTPATFVEELTPVAQALAESGKYFMFHNHAAEFTKDEDGVHYLTRLAEGMS